MPLTCHEMTQVSGFVNAMSNEKRIREQCGSSQRLLPSKEKRCEDIKAGLEAARGGLR